MSETNNSPERLKPNEAQEAALKDLSERYGVTYSPDHYFVNSDDAIMMPGWAEGWIGGWDIQQEKATIYVGCSPAGEIHS